MDKHSLIVVSKLPKLLKGIIAVSVLGLAAAATCTPAMAVPIAGVEFTTDVQINNNGNWDMGYRFDLTAADSLYALGAFDGGGDGLTGSHVVAVFTSGGSLLASTTVTTSSTLLGHFRYENLASPLALGVGSYVVLAMGWGGVDDDWAQTNGAFTTAADVANVERRFRTSTGTLDLVNVDVGCCSTSGYFGGNILLGGPVGNVPEPVSVALLGLGLIGIGLSRRKRG